MKSSQVCKGRCAIEKENSKLHPHPRSGWRLMEKEKEEKEEVGEDEPTYTLKAVGQDLPDHSSQLLGQ